MDPKPIPFSSADLERRRLETTIDQDLHSLSLTTITSSTNTETDHADDLRQRGHDAYGTLHKNQHQHQHHAGESDTSFSTLSTIEYPRGVAYPPASQQQQQADMSFAHFSHSYSRDHQYRSDKPTLVGPHGTPRASRPTQQHTQARKVSERSLMEASPVSTADHHVSAVTLADGVFARPMGSVRNQEDDAESGSEWDPDRSLGRLVGELGKVMQAQVSTRPTSPFSPTRSPRSPSPYTSSQLNPNLSFTLNRADPLPSPPQSRAGSASGSGSSSGSRTVKMTGNTVPVQQPAPRRRALGESNLHNISQPQRTQQSKSDNEANKAKHAAQQARPASAPAKRGVMGDVTGMTGLLDTPDKALVHGIVGKSGNVGVAAADGVPDTLSSLHARLRALETENSVSRRRVRELESEVERAKAEVESARTSDQGRLQEVLSEKTALEDLVKSLRTSLSRLTIELEQHKATVAELRAAAAQSQPQALASPPRSQVANELIALRREVERLSGEVHRLGGIVEQGLETRKKARGEETIRADRVEDLISLSDEDVQRVQKDVERRSTKSAPARTHGQNAQPMQEAQQQTRAPSKLRQGTHRAGSPDPELVDASIHQSTPTAAPAQSTRPRTQQQQQQQQRTDDHDSSSGSDTRRQNKSRSKPSRVQDGPSSPFPSIREEDEFDFFEASRRATVGSGANTPTLRELGLGAGIGTDGLPPSIAQVLGAGKGEIPPQTVLTRVIATLESDFKHYKAIYSELADQYKVLDAASAMAKRHVLAEHLKEVIDTLEEKADQIASLYTLLSFKDLPSTSTAVHPIKVSKSVPDVIRMVRDTLGEEGLRRLEEDGVIRPRSKKGGR